jgi:hypothetical protein
MPVALRPGKIRYPLYRRLGHRIGLDCVENLTLNGVRSTELSDGSDTL